MGLSCGCNYDWEPEPGNWYWSDEPADYQPLPFKKSKKCCSCKCKIKPGDLSTEHMRSKVPASEIECRIYGDDGAIPIASDWQCERCSDLYFSLAELGYCVNPRDDMRELVREHSAIKRNGA